MMLTQYINLYFQLIYFKNIFTQLFSCLHYVASCFFICDHSLVSIKRNFLFKVSQYNKTQWNFYF